MLPGCIAECIGSTLAAGYLAKQLSLSLNKNVAVSYNSREGCTVVHFADETESQRNPDLQLSADALTLEIAKPHTATSQSTVAGRKNPPRPMNCWMLYRDAKHKQLKAADPHKSVQDISKECSHYWNHQMSLEEKNTWRKAAADAKAEHRRMYPNYKYAPRKPGQKKKRQSRKSTQSAAVTSPAQTATAMPTIVDFNSFLNSTPSMSTTGTDLTTAADAIATNINSTLPTGVTSLAETNSNDGHDESQMAFAFEFQDLEFGRHDLLEGQFGATFGPDIFNDETFAFRDDADRTVTMPSPYTDTY
ncbi:hypothetical protein CC80DRAFT_402450 [Byssothecium circinans]|uniref:HMG box domain-containing protein n=1 Tax=Byssothecium circinans TaxID=147558 RepID=A0A6A5U8N6_9PLEO|nr:hypothetical protein CC80DRAFT_402450 [Byssothecium circinans]